MKLSMTTITAAAFCAFGLAAQASPVVLNYSDTVSQSDIDGASVGEIFNIELILDNGSTGLISQSWDADDFVSVLVTTSGGYALSGDVLNPVADTFADVQTDAFGELSALDIDEIHFFGSDTNGQTSFEIFLNGLNDVLFYTNSDGFQTDGSIGAISPPTINNTTISGVATVPLPAGGLLLLGALGAAGAARRKKAA